MNDYADLKAQLAATPLYDGSGEETDLGGNAAAAIDALERERDEAEAREKRLREALRWCGVARKGWLKICAALKEDKSHE